LGYAAKTSLQCQVILNSVEISPAAECQEWKRKEGSAMKSCLLFRNKDSEDLWRHWFRSGQLLRLKSSAGSTNNQTFHSNAVNPMFTTNSDQPLMTGTFVTHYRPEHVSSRCTALVIKHKVKKFFFCSHSDVISDAIILQHLLSILPVETSDSNRLLSITERLSNSPVSDILSFTLI